jgi:hypothetical protein
VTLLKAAAQGLEDRITAIAERAYKKYRKAVHPIYGVKGESPAHIGTCFFLKVGAHRYVVTAAHVIDEAESSTLYIPIGRRLAAVNGSFACTSAPSRVRDLDYYDFAYAVADDEYFLDDERVAWIEESDISLNRVSVDTHAYMLIGYPRSKNKDPDNARQSIDPKIWHYYATGRLVPEMYARLALSGEDHISIKYEERSRSAEGVWDNSISARGMSGGPLIDLGAQLPPTDTELTDSFDGRLAGVLIEEGAEEDVLVSTKINLIVDKIRAGVVNDAHIGPDREI